MHINVSLPYKNHNKVYVTWDMQKQYNLETSDFFALMCLTSLKDMKQSLWIWVFYSLSLCVWDVKMELMYKMNAKLPVV